LRLLLLLTGLFLIVASPVVAQIPTRNMQVMSHVDEYHTPVGVIPYAYSACWGYAHPDGREYAVIGTSGGTAIYNVTNPKAPFRVAFILGPNSVWREMKQYRSWIYIVTEGTWGNTRGLQIVRMTDPDHPVLAATYTAPNYVAAHTVSVDTTRALLYLNGTRSQSAPDVFPFQGMQILSLAQPEAPVLLSTWPNAWPFMADTYVHDSVPVGNRVYAASIYAGTERVIDVSDPAHPVQTTSWTYPGAYYTHNSWPDAAGSALYVTDEQNGQTLRVFDIHDLAQPRLVTGFSANPLAIVHNAVVEGHDLYVANYTEGVRVLDLTDPLHPAEFGWADTYPGPSGGYSGVWGVCPTLPSGTVIASDMQSGLWVFRVQRNYGRVRVQVVDAATQQPLAGVKVRATPLGDSLVTGGDGIVQFAPGFGVQQIRAERFGWTTVSKSVAVMNGGFQSLTLALDLQPLTSYAGEVRNATNQSAISDADVFLTRTPLATRTDADGAYRLDAVPENDYQVEIHRPGFIPQSLPRHIGLAFPGEDFSLTPAALWDSLESQGQWTAGAPGDNAYEGMWRLVAPVGTGVGPASPGAGISRMRLAADDGPDAEAARSVLVTRRAPERASACGDVDRASAGNAMCSGAAGAVVASANGDDEPSGHCGCGSTCVCGVGLSSTPALQVKPWFDRTPGSGMRCFVTGQADSHTVDPDNADLDGGKTTLTSPGYDLSSATDPVIGYWRWFYSHSLTTGHPDDFDWLAVMVSNDNGASWTKVDTVRGERNAWEEATIHVRDFVTPTATVRVRFVANDGGANTTVEAAIDDLTLYDAAAAVGAPPPGSVRLEFAAPWPNPSAGEVRFALQVPQTTSLTVEIVDLRGALVRRLHRGPASGPVALTWDGRDARGHAAAAGVYFAVARAGAEVTRARIIRLP
jgi:choice-of-anchor B domain-containing protein